MAGPNLMIDKLRRMDLSVAPPTWLPVILSIKALIFLPFSREGHMRLANPLATLESIACDDATGVPTPRQRASVEETSSLAGYPVAEV
jgi:hypothetical protein